MTELTLQDVEAAATRIEGRVRPLTVTSAEPAMSRGGTEFVLSLIHI
mgnify:CR=1 FL=1